MISLARLAKGLAALVVLIALVLGIPWALWHFVGWPFPHHLPSPDQVGRGLNRQGIPAQTLVDVLAIAVWFSWATLVASLAAEVPAALSGRRPRHLPVAGFLQPMTGWLVAAVIVAALSFAPRSSQSASAMAKTPPPLSSRPIATLIVKNATLTSSDSPATPVKGAIPPMGTPAQTSRADPPVAAAPVTYVVQRGDTLWGIAQEQLGDPLRWSEIFALNQGRPEPGGVMLTDPHWIDPGWTLVLPTPEVAAAPPPAVGPAQPAAPPAPPSAIQPAPSPATTTSTTASTVPQTERQPAHSDRQTTPERGGVVALPSGSVVGASFAAGVGFAVAIGRLRRRHAYRYRPPRPANTRTTADEHPTLSRLRLAGAPREEVKEGNDPVAPFTELERRERPDQIEIGTRDGATVTVELTHLSGLALFGSTSADIATAIVAALLVRAEPGSAEVLLPEQLALDLFPGLDASRAFRRTGTVEHTASVLESERLTRRAAARRGRCGRRRGVSYPEPRTPLSDVARSRGESWQ